MSGRAEGVQVAQEYYDSSDADTFYEKVWGGEDIHIGIYESEVEPIRDASRRTVEKMAAQAQGMAADARVLDLGAGYGGAARYLAGQCGFRVDCLNISERQNERNRRLNTAQGLEDQVGVMEGNFEEIPFEDGQFDVVWSQDAILHSARKERVLHEIGRVLKPGGRLIFTDPMQSDDCPEGVLGPILERIHLQALGSPRLYRDLARRSGLEEVGFLDYSEHLPRHYGRVGDELRRQYDELVKVVSRDYVDRMLQGLQHWVRGGQAGHLCWGILHFRKAV